MKQKDVFKKIGGIIQELSDQYDYLKTTNDDLNDLELELFASNAHFLTDHIEILCKLNLQKVREKQLPEKKREAAPENKQGPVYEKKQDMAYEKKYFEPVVQQMKNFPDTDEPEKQAAPVAKINIKPESAEDTFSFVRQEPETIRHELILDEAMYHDEDEQTENEIEPVKEVKKRKTDAPVTSEAPHVQPAEINEDNEIAAILSDTEVLTINQKMSSRLKDKGIAGNEQLSIKPISDIKLAITLNDKLLYVKDLFNGYNLAYSEAVEILNRFNNFDEASRFLKTNYITKNNWESKPATTEKFYALLKRRYA